MNPVTPFDFLCDEPERINPAILLAEELMRKGLAEILDSQDLERAEDALEISRQEIELVETQLTNLTKTPAAPGTNFPPGF